MSRRSDPAGFKDSLLPEDRGGLRRPRRALWQMLVALFVAAVSLLLTLAFQHRSEQMRHTAEAAAETAAAEMTQLLSRDLADLLALPSPSASPESWRIRTEDFLVHHPEILRIEHRDPQMQILSAADSRSRPPLFGQLGREQFKLDTELACATAQKRAGPIYSENYFVPRRDGTGIAAMDLCIAEVAGTTSQGYVVASFQLSSLLDQLPVQLRAPGYDIYLVDVDGTRVAHGSRHAGTGAFVELALLSLPGVTMQLQLDSWGDPPSLVPDLVTGLVMALSLALTGVIWLLMRDGMRRAHVEAALAESLSFRKAMEDSIVTGLRARDLEGHTTYVNPAFCAMVGFDRLELVGVDPPPYWPPERLEQFRSRRELRMASWPANREEPLETFFMRRNGERFPVMVFEAPLMGRSGRQQGWMSSVLDLSEQRRVEELSRQQQDRLQATARLATVGEMASLLSHELNQPLSAISAFAEGSLNLLDTAAEGDGALRDAMMREAAMEIRDQAERAGRVIQSVHNFVRRREGLRASVAPTALIDSILPLVKLQARKSQTLIAVDVAPDTPNVTCDGAMVEQVLLNLARNGIQSLEALPAGRDRVLTLRVRRVDGAAAPRVQFSVIDGGAGIAAEVAAQLFAPFFTTRSEGMGLGLSVCRTIVEQHGGTLSFSNLAGADGMAAGVDFSFTLPVAAPRP
jgi:two-component system sensor histidine kinase DctS